MPREKPLSCPETGEPCFETACTVKLCHERQLALAEKQAEASKWNRLAEELGLNIKIGQREAMERHRKALEDDD